MYVAWPSSLVEVVTALWQLHWSTQVHAGSQSHTFCMLLFWESHALFLLFLARRQKGTPSASCMECKLTWDTSAFVISVWIDLCVCVLFSEFEVNIVIIFQDDHLITENFPVVLTRYWGVYRMKSMPCCRNEHNITYISSEALCMKWAVLWRNFIPKIVKRRGCS